MEFPDSERKEKGLRNGVLEKKGEKRNPPMTHGGRPMTDGRGKEGRFVLTDREEEKGKKREHHPQPIWATVRGGALCCYKEGKGARA